MNNMFMFSWNDEEDCENTIFQAETTNWVFSFIFIKAIYVLIDITLNIMWEYQITILIYRKEWKWRGGLIRFKKIRF